MQYKEALQYIYGLTDYEKPTHQAFSAANFDLRRVHDLLSRLKDPHLGPVTVHVAGTKGKGSACAMIASVLSCAGHRTGFFSSPHLTTFRERIRVDGRLISEEEVADLVGMLKPVVEEMNLEAKWGRITTFEVMAALAFCYFRDKGVDAQVLEVGMGGRLDATNVVRADVSVITPVSLDHTAILGETIPEIAAEKAGIIKEGGTVVMAPQPPEARDVILGVAREKGARALEVEKELRWSRGEGDLDGQHIAVEGKRGRYELTLPLLGEFQVENAATAIAALELLKETSSVALSAGSIIRGLAQVDWPGRMQALQRRPLWIVDGAHNTASAARLRESLEKDFSYHRLLLLMAISSDKNVAGIVETLAPIASAAIVTRTSNARATDPHALALEFSRAGVDVRLADTVPDAMAVAREMASEDDLVCATGSLFLVGEVIQQFTGEPGDGV